MASDKLVSLEARVRQLVELVQTLKRENAGLKTDVRTTRERSLKQNELNHRWIQERTDIKGRIEKVLSDVDAIEFLEETKEVAS